MITRDPLKVPCLTEGYWATFPELNGRHLARAISLVRNSPRNERLPWTSKLPRDEQVRAEDDNVRRCLAFARDQLGE
jgi:3-oxoisoapionate decarboxylase